MRKLILIATLAAMIAFACSLLINPQKNILVDGAVLSYKFKARGRFIFKASGEASAVHLINFKNVHATEIDANYFPEIWKILTDEIVAIPAHYYIILDSEENNSWCAVYNNGDILCAFTEEMKDKLTK